MTSQNFNSLKPFSATLLLLLACYSYSFATWSIILIDPETREIGIAGASCTYNCYGIGGIIPGKGAIIVQAMSNKEAKARGLEMIISGNSPEQIIAELRNTIYDPERQQYAVVTLQHLLAPKTYTGDSTHVYNGALTATGISVQGNTLASNSAIQKILEAVLNARKEGLRIDAILMKALEAGAQDGGDKRCGEQKATTAFITVARPDDHPKRPYLNLVIFGQGKGGQNAVVMLRNKYDKWKVKQQAKEK
ncbi:DUF1028 domain-containing protein [Rhodocytophaga rosea]|uniref:DUF1028 domain-containing protein n=1 Tax=Rhodocytophaga rosea TaxID=2704465 RepID=A0A6C0GK10_9BACT|nr:DUF1028 domain-containing protein [Rhodocytophaga rosea]QHT68411.1 DUF1028 domain-containing protein [Rhodocytophaga rosea]